MYSIISGDYWLLAFILFISTPQELIMNIKKCFFLGANTLTLSCKQDDLLLDFWNYKLPKIHEMQWRVWCQHVNQRQKTELKKNMAALVLAEIPSIFFLSEQKDTRCASIEGKDDSAFLLTAFGKFDLSVNC